MGLLVSILPVPTNAQTDDYPLSGATESLEGLDAFFDGAIGAVRTMHKIPGVTVSVVHNGEIVFSKGYGYTDLARLEPVDPERSLFRIGSTSKPFTWIAILQLATQGKLDLDADVNNYLGAFKIPATFQEPVTLRHILTHTAGFEDGGLGFLFDASHKTQTGLEGWLSLHMPERVRAPGTYAAYSNYGAALAGYIVAQVSGLDFDTYIEENIFDPLGMAQSTFREPIPEHLAAIASGNFKHVLGDYVEAGFEFIHDAGPAGSMSSTANDMARFMLSLLGGGHLDGNTILEPSAARLLFDRQFGHHDSISGLTYGLIEIPTNGRAGYGHSGDTSIFHTQMILLPSEKVGIFLSTNSPAGAQGVRQIAPSFFDTYFPARDEYPHPSPTDVETSDAKQFEVAKYVASYRSNRRSYTTWEKSIALSGDLTVAPHPKGGLHAVAGGTSLRLLSTDEEGVFQSVDDADLKVVFQADETGAVSHAFLGPLSAFEKVGTLEAASTHQLLLGLGFTVFLGNILGSLWSVKRWWAMPRIEFLASGAVFVSAILNVAFVGGLFIALSDQNSLLFNGLPSPNFLLFIPFAAAAFAAIAFGFSFIVWRDGFWTRFVRVRFSAVVLTLLTFAWILNYWNLLGPWYA